MQSDLLYWIPEQEKDKSGKTGDPKEVWTLGNRVTNHPGLPGLKGSLRHGTSSFKNQDSSGLSGTRGFLVQEAFSAKTR